MVVRRFTEEYRWVFPPSRLWKASVLNANELIPKLMPEVVASAGIVEGDGGVGTTRQMNFTGAIKEFRYVKDRIDVMDEESLVFKYTVIEGGLIGLKLQSYSFETTFKPSGDGGSISNLTVEYDTMEGKSLSEVEMNSIKGATVAIAKAIEDYLKANPAAYA